MSRKRDRSMGPWDGLKKQEGIPPTSDSVTIDAYTPVPSQNWLLRTMLNNMTRRPGLCHSIKPRYGCIRLCLIGQSALTSVMGRCR